MKYIKLYEQAQPEKSVKYYANGSVRYEEWYQNGKLHREDGPAWISYRQDGSVASEAWWFEGKQARDITSLEDFRAWQYLKSVGLV